MTVDSDFLDKGVHVHARARSAGRSARVYSSTTVHTCHEPDAGSSTQTPPPCAAPDLSQWKRPDLPALAVAASPPASTGRHRSRIINMSLFISNTQFICELCDVHSHVLRLPRTATERPPRCWLSIFARKPPETHPVCVSGGVTRAKVFPFRSRYTIAAYSLSSRRCLK